MRTLKVTLVLFLLVAMAVLLVIPAVLTLSGVSPHAAMNSDVSIIKQEPQANITDAYTFIDRK